MMHQIALLAFALFLAAAGPCDFLGEPTDNETDGAVACTEMGCQDQLTVEVVRADNLGFMSGLYTFEVEVPEAQLSYWIECAAGYGDGGLDCDAGDLAVLGARLDSTGSTLWVDCAMAPVQALVRVSYNGLPIGERAIAPVYEEVFPNGPDCPPACWQGTATMAVESW